MNITFRHIITGICLLTASTLGAISPQEVDDAVKAAKDAPKNKALNYSAGEALKYAGRYSEAVPFYLNSNNSGNLGLAEVYFYLYDYDKAEEYLDKYVAKRTKAEAEKDMDFSFGDGSETMDWTEHLRSRIELGRSMLDRVEKIQIIDSINVPSDRFFEFIKLAKSAGSLQSESVIEEIVPQAKMEELEISECVSPVYESENGDDLIWYGTTDTGESKMYESIRLADGSWDNPSLLFDYKTIFGNPNGTLVAYPFLMSDGVTLYFAADGEASLGDLDIFISRRDEDGFLQPSNIGMPYNSPHNDYLYAIDEQTGTGWWATDRNQIEDSVTIYTFIPQDLRINYPVDTENLTDFAKVSSIAATQNEGVDYSELRNKIANLSVNKSRENETAFEFAFPGGIVYTSLSDFKNSQAKEMMGTYLRALANRDTKLSHLAELRNSYRNGETSVAYEIKNLEKSLETDALELKRTKNQIIKTENASH